MNASTPAAPAGPQSPASSTDLLIAALTAQNEKLVAAMEQLAAPPRPPAEVSSEVETLIREYAQVRSRLASVGDPNDPTVPGRVVAVVPETGPVGQRVLLFLRGLGRISDIGFLDRAGDSVPAPIRDVVRGVPDRPLGLSATGSAGQTLQVAVRQGEEVVATEVPAGAVSGPIAVRGPEGTVLSPRFEVTTTSPPVWRAAVLSGWKDRGIHA